MRVKLQVISEDNSGGLLNLDSSAAPNTPEAVREVFVKKDSPSKPPTR